MKRMILLFIILMMSITPILCDSAITRGPAVGEIYFISSTRTTPAAIYHSTDFGETSTVMDSTLGTSEYLFERISADLTPGVIYSMYFNSLFVSYDYGREGSWIFRTSEGTTKLSSGRNEGEIFKGIGRSSVDYGINFTQHQCSGFFGEFKAFDFDNENSVGYALVRESGILDSMWLLISHNNYETLDIIHVFNDYIGVNYLSRGYEYGELFLYRYHNLYGTSLLYSGNYGETWELKNTFNCPNLPITGIVGGRQPGELYMLVEYVQLMHSRIYVYIYHSIDYGETFTIHPVLEYGPEPYYANFIATPDSGSAPLTVQFTDSSSGGGNLDWQWDFDDDGVIDSYEQNPEYTFQTSGTYRVTLQIEYGMGVPEIVARKDIHVTAGNEIDEYAIQNSKLKIQNYPNPFNPITTISFELPKDIENPAIEIYNLRGQRIRELKIYYGKRETGDGRRSVVWDGKDQKGNSVSSGIYLYRLNIENSPIKKMILLK